VLKPSVDGGGPPFGRTITAFLTGSTVGGITLGVGLAVISGLTSDTFRRGFALGISLLALLALFSPSLSRLIPERECQVRESRMFRRQPAALGFGWGWQLGLGLATYSVTPALYALVATSLVLPSGASVVVCGFYGLLRGSVIGWFAWREAHGPYRSAPLGAIKRGMKLPLATAVLLGCTSTFRAL
jgi:hypothetical protein